MGGVLKQVFGASKINLFDDNVSDQMMAAVNSFNTPRHHHLLYDPNTFVADQLMGTKAYEPFVKIEKTLRRMSTLEIFKLSAHPGGNGTTVSLRLRMQTQERDSGAADWIAINRFLLLADLERMAESEDRICEVVMSILFEMVTHEMQEQFRINGKIWKDPHEGE